MGVSDVAAKLFGMSPAVWERHANPWSGWSRLTALPLIALAAWSRVEIGFWSWALAAGVALWIWLNPRLFPPPRRTDNWMSRGVLGERVWIARASVPIPAHHRRAGAILNGLSAGASLAFVAGLVWLDPCVTLAGMLLAMLAKLWFVDRMVWLYEDMRRVHPPYEAWMRP